MPKSRLFDRKQLLAPARVGFEGNLEASSQAILYNVPIYLDIMSWDGAAAGITSESSLLTGAFIPVDWQATTVLIEFEIAGVMNTDAAAGTTTFRVNEENAGGNIVTITGAEQNNVTAGGWVYRGGVLLFGEDVSGWVARNNATALYPTQGIAEVSDVAVFSHSPLDQFFVDITIQSSDAGTEIDRMQGYLRVTFMDPNRSNVLEP